MGTISPAKELLDEMPQRNVRYWDILAHGYLHHGDTKPTLNLELFQVPMDDRVQSELIVFAVGVISAYLRLGALDQGQWIDSHLKKKSRLLDVVTETSLVNTYMRFGDLDHASLFV